MTSAADHPRRGRRAHGPDPIANDRRAARRKHALGPDAACALCGEQTPETLSRISHTTLEEHHASGRANDPDLTVVLCRNCHARVTEAQLRLGVDLHHRERRTLLELTEAALLSLAAFDRARADAEQKQAAKHRAFEARLDRDCPGWRDWPEARA
jgi:5-methylcytosine-specific restriction endonuclease McrA